MHGAISHSSKRPPDVILCRSFTRPSIPLAVIEGLGMRLRWSHEGACTCNSGSIQIRITYMYVFLFWWDAMHTQCTSCGLSPTLGYVAMQKINNGRIASARNSDSRLHRRPRRDASWKWTCTKEEAPTQNSLFAAYALALEIPAATVPSVLQTKAPQNGEGSRHLRILRVFEADRFLHHRFAWTFLHD